MDVVTFENLEVLEILENAAYLRGRVRKHDRPEICEVARRTIDNVLKWKIAVIRTLLKSN